MEQHTTWLPLDFYRIKNRMAQSEATEMMRHHKIMVQFVIRFHAPFGVLLSEASKFARPV